MPSIMFVTKHVIARLSRLTFSFFHIPGEEMMNSTNTLLRLAKIGPLFTRNLAYVSNKRITRIPSDLDVKKDEIDNTGNNVYIDVNLKNRNPRNLEQMLLLPKPMGFELDTPNPHYWNKFCFIILFLYF